MSNFAFLSDTDFSSTKLFDPSGNLFVNWITKPKDLGVRTAQLYDLCANSINLAAYNQYSDSLLRGIPGSVFKPDTPLGVRYFMPVMIGDTPKKCGAPDGSIVDQYYVVDGLSKAAVDVSSGAHFLTPACGPSSSNGNYTCNGNSIVFSAAATINNIDASLITPFFTVDKSTNIFSFTSPSDDVSFNTYNKCKKIEIVTNEAGKTESNYVSINDANRFIKAAVAKEAFQTQRMVHGHDGAWSRSASGTDFGGYIIGADLSDPRYIPRKDIAIASMHSSYASIDDTGDLDYMLFQQRIKDQIAMREESRAAAKKGYDAITGFFLGSVTVLGLFIVFQFLDIRSATKIASHRK